MIKKHSWNIFWGHMLCASLLLATTAQAVVPIEQTETLRSVNEILDSADTLRRSIDRSEFDLNAALDKTDYEAGEIVRFLKQEIAFEQYSGALRGPTGTLMSKAGNALDQSILLAKLLKDAGYDARIARTSLSEPQALLLLNELVVEKSSSDLELDTAALQKMLQSSGVASGLDQEERDSMLSIDKNSLRAEDHPLFKQSMATSEMLETALRKNNVAFNASSDGAQESDRLIKEARDYFWVQFRDSAADGWSDQHPAFRGDPGFDLQFTEVYTDSVPEDLQHKLRFQVFIETLSNGKLTVKPLASPWERPTANLNGIPLVYSNLSNVSARNPSLAIKPNDILSQTGWFLPIFGRDTMGGASYFDLSGNLIDPMAASSAGADLFKTIGDRFSMAIGNLDAAAVPRLTAQWLEFTLTAPDGTERSYRRTTMDRIGPAARMSGVPLGDIGEPTTAELAPLLQKHTFMVAMGTVPRAMALESVLKDLSDSRPLIDAVAEGALSGGIAQDKLSRILRDVPVHWTGYLALLSRLDSADQLNSEGSSYRSGPLLMIHRAGPNADGVLEQGIDIVQNPRRAVSRSADGVTLNPSAVLRAGVWETTLEGSLLPRGDSSENTQTVFDRAKSAGADVKLVTNKEQLAGLTLDANSKASMAADLDRGAVLMVPDRLTSGAAGWWRIDPITGETIGQILDGRGSAVEYLEGIALGISICLLGISLLNCANAYNPETLADVEQQQLNAACCGLGSILMFALGYAVGLIHWTVGAVYDSATSFAPTLCQGNS